MGWEGVWEEGLGWGTHVLPMADSCQCMVKNHYKIVIGLQLNKLLKKKKRCDDLLNTMND